MSNQAILYIFLMCASLTSCHTTPKDKVVRTADSSYIKYSYYSNKQIATEEHYFIDHRGREIKQGDEKYFYENGKLKAHSIFAIVDSSTEEVTYNEYTRTYFDNGNLKSEYDEFQGKPVGQKTVYYNDGKLKELSLFTDSEFADNEVRFQLRLDEMSRIKEMIGFPLIAWMEKKTVRKDEQTPAIYTLVEAGSLRSKLRVYTTAPSGKRYIDSYTTLEKSYTDHSLFLKHQFSEAGKYVLTYQIELSDTLFTHPIFNDSFTDTIYVVQ